MMKLIRKTRATIHHHNCKIKSSITLILLLIIIPTVTLILLSTPNHPQPSSSSPSITPAIDAQPSSSNSNDEVLYSFIFFNVLKNGKVNIFSSPPHLVPPVTDRLTGVKLKDVHIAAGISARIFLPPPGPSGDDVTFPVMLYVHGGGFCMQSAFSAEYTRFLISLSSLSRTMIVSVEYRMFPSHSISLCYDDSDAALKWIADAARADEWIRRYGDFRGKGLFLAGDSAGGNICHTLAARSGRAGLNVTGMVLIHPYFGEDDKMWMYMCKENEGPEDRRMKPAREDLRVVAAERVLVIVAERDSLRDQGVKYAARLRESGWRGGKGRVEVVENKARDHCWFLGLDPRNRNDLEAVGNLNRINSFIHQKN